MDWSSIYLFELILMRVTGFVIANPLFGRSNLSNLVKGGFIMVLSVFVWNVDQSVPAPPAPWWNLCFTCCWSWLWG